MGMVVDVNRIAPSAGSPTCGLCCYRINGYCHRFPPYGRTGWPQVAEDQWCGEFQRRSDT
jgi:hypothetical protein